MELPKGAFTDEFHRLFEFSFYQRMAEIEDLIAQDANEVHLPWPADAVALANGRINSGRIKLIGMHGLVAAWIPIGRAAIVRTVDAVRSRILDLALELEQVSPELGDVAGTAAEYKEEISAKFQANITANTVNLGETLQGPRRARRKPRRMWSSCRAAPRLDVITAGAGRVVKARWQDRSTPAAHVARREDRVARRNEARTAPQDRSALEQSQSARVGTAGASRPRYCHRTALAPAPTRRRRSPVLALSTQLLHCEGGRQPSTGPCPSTVEHLVEGGAAGVLDQLTEQVLLE